MTHPGYMDREGSSWQSGVWDTMASSYLRDVDTRFVPVVDELMSRAELRPDMRVLDIGTGTGTVALRAAALVPEGEVLGLDISEEMLAIARHRAAGESARRVSFEFGGAEDLPVEDGSVDCLLASLSLMFVLDRKSAATEFARVLRTGGRLVATCWADPERCDIVRFQMMAGRFGVAPPVSGVGPGSMGDPREFMAQLGAAGFNVDVESVATRFVFDTFDHAWDVLASVTCASLTKSERERARSAVREAMWPDDGGPRVFENLTHIVTGVKG